jgi:hypothetical protein
MELCLHFFIYLQVSTGIYLLYLPSYFRHKNYCTLLHSYKMLVNHPLSRVLSGLSYTYIHVSATELLSSPSSRHLHKVERTTNLLLKVRQRLQSYSMIQTRLRVSFFFSIRSIFECWELKNWAADQLRQSSHLLPLTAVIFSRKFLVKMWRVR